MNTEKLTSVGDKSSAKEWLITEEVVVCLCDNKNYARDLRQALNFARHFDNGYIY